MYEHIFADKFKVQLKNGMIVEMTKEAYLNFLNPIREEEKKIVDERNKIYKKKTDEYTKKYKPNAKLDQEPQEPSEPRESGESPDSETGKIPGTYERDPLDKTRQDFGFDIIGSDDDKIIIFNNINEKVRIAYKIGNKPVKVSMNSGNSNIRYIKRPEKEEVEIWAVKKFNNNPTIKISYIDEGYYYAREITLKFAEQV